MLTPQAIQQLCQLLDAEPDIRQHLREKVDQETRAKVFVDPICPNCLHAFSRYRTYQVFCCDNCRKLYHQKDKQRARQAA